MQYLFRRRHTLSIQTPFFSERERAALALIGTRHAAFGRARSDATYETVRPYLTENGLVDLAPAIVAITDGTGSYQPPKH